MILKLYCEHCEKRTSHYFVSLVQRPDGTFRRWACRLCGEVVGVYVNPRGRTGEIVGSGD